MLLVETARVVPYSTVIQLLDRDISNKNNIIQRIYRDIAALKQKYDENLTKIKKAMVLPYLVADVSEIIDDKSVNGDILKEESDSEKKVVIKTSTRNCIFLPSPGLVDSETLKPGMTVGVKNDSFIIIEKIEKDISLKSCETDLSHCEHFSDIGGLEKQIEELKEAVILPFSEKEKFTNIGINFCNGVLLYGPPGNGKTLLARACALEGEMVFLSIAGSRLVHPNIGQGAKLVRELFQLANEKSPSVIFIDELDAVGMKRSDTSKSGEREVQRTMLELLSQLDKISTRADIKVIAASSRIDILDPALIRSGRFEKKIEIPFPGKKERAHIMKIHSRKMTVSPNINFDELSELAEGFCGSLCKAVCIEAGMLALKRNESTTTQVDYIDAISELKGKSTSLLDHYS